MIGNENIRRAAEMRAQHHDHRCRLWNVINEFVAYPDFHKLWPSSSLRPEWTQRAALHIRGSTLARLNREVAQTRADRGFRSAFRRLAALLGGLTRARSLFRITDGAERALRLALRARFFPVLAGLGAGVTADSQDCRARHGKFVAGQIAPDALGLLFQRFIFFRLVLYQQDCGLIIAA